MINLLKIKLFFFSLLFIIILAITIIQSIYQDYTSIIDFDLTVIHNSLQLVSNQYPDFQDLTAYSHFLTYGLFYKLISFFDSSIITNIDSLISLEYPELMIQKLYIISRVANAIIHFVMIIFIYKLLNIFKVQEYYKLLTIFFIIISESFIANFIILRTDIVAVCYFYISAFFLLNFIKHNNLFNLFLVSFFMILSLLAKVQIIFLYMFLFLFFIFYYSYESKEENFKENFLLLKVSRFSKYFLLLSATLYITFQIYLNEFVNSSTGVGYFDTFCFGIYFLIIYSTFLYFDKIKKVSINYVYSIFLVIILFAIFNVLLLKLLNILGYIKFDFRIIFSLTNPFYFLKIYSPFASSELSLEFITKMIFILFADFKFNYIYLFIIFTIFLISIFKIYINFKKRVFDHNYIYIILLIMITLFLTSINNLRYNVSYEIYAIPFLFLLVSIFFNLTKEKFKYIFSILITFFIISNFFANLDNYKSYFYKPSNLDTVCINKKTRDFYYYWARNFDETFFKKICSNNNLLFK